MDFTPTDEQSAARGLAAGIFGDLATPDRLAAAGTGTDPTLWRALCAAGLPAAVPEIGLLGLVLLLEEQGRTTAQTPFATSGVHGLLALTMLGTDEQRARLLPGLGDGTAVATGAIAEPAAVRAEALAGRAGRAGRTGGGGRGGPGGAAQARLSGTVAWVPWLRDATHVLVADSGRALWWVRVADAETVPVETTAPWAAGRLVLDATPAERVGPAHAPPGAGYEEVRAVARIAFAGLQAGVCAGALARAVEHTTTREQFGRPLAAHQGVQLRAADAHMDVESMRLTVYEAAWRYDEGLPYARHALTAAWWASEAGKRVVHTGQHLHGGLGADLEHPVHRHFLWGRQLDAYLGCGSEVLAELGALLAEEGAA
ncbi:acyl-CoA dehydrogenase family protein [Streptomyces yaizuensis]|uniref:Acyl-CoA/acyl-ACP dehydrogenase n=1 Tax=Streptomyces yaizuensis TaxID=2989713 RepID=A0ABQ5P012_9ACTN|nr:acyl-CoA dehydrogenase family protein [Streptomyces sp. YSPA8]GLF95795.1 acyl-CoA/acyl-ACP dehydrogenase [Streptomyces sp. YSPA8]